MSDQVVEFGGSNSALSRCARCVLPSNYPNIRFDQHGICNYCLSHVPAQHKGESALRAVLDAHRGKGKKYDCIVALSGGKDSSYVLYEAVRRYKMRTLAANYESGFASVQAKQNVNNAIKALGVDYVRIRSRRDIQKKCLKDDIEGWIQNPSSDVIPNLCRGCLEGYLHGAYRIAACLGIPLLLLGATPMEDMYFKTVLHRWNLRFSEWLLAKLARDPLYFRPRRVYHRMLLHAEFPTRGGGAMCCNDAMPWLILRRMMPGPPRVLRWFEYVPYDEKTIMSRVATELGWKKPKNATSSWRFDCKIHAIVDLMYMKRLGFSEKDDLYSKMIREGSLTRDEALKRIEAEHRGEEEKLAVACEVLGKLGLSGMESRLLGLAR